MTKPIRWATLILFIICLACNSLLTRILGGILDLLLVVGILCSAWPLLRKQKQDD